MEGSPGLDCHRRYRYIESDSKAKAGGKGAGPGSRREGREGLVQVLTL